MINSDLSIHHIHFFRNIQLETKPHFCYIFKQTTIYASHKSSYFYTTHSTSTGHRL